MGAEGGACDVATEAFQPLSVAVADGGAAVQGEPVAGGAARGQRVLAPAMRLHPPHLASPEVRAPGERGGVDQGERVVGVLLFGLVGAVPARPEPPLDLEGDAVDQDADLVGGRRGQAVEPAVDPRRVRTRCCTTGCWRVVRRGVGRWSRRRRKRQRSRRRMRCRGRRGGEGRGTGRGLGCCSGSSGRPGGVALGAGGGWCCGRCPGRRRRCASWTGCVGRRGARRSGGGTWSRGRRGPAGTWMCAWSSGRGRFRVPGGPWGAYRRGRRGREAFEQSVVASGPVFGGNVITGSSSRDESPGSRRSRLGRGWRASRPAGRRGSSCTSCRRGRPG